MGSPKKRRRRRALSSVLGITAPFSSTELARMGSSDYVMNAARHNLYAEGRPAAPFADGKAPDDSIDRILVGSGLAGLSKLSDLDLTGVARMNVSAGAAPANHTNLIIGSATFHFTNQGGGGEATGTILPSDHETCASCIAVQLAADGSQGAQLIAAMADADVQAAHPDISTITVTADNADGAVNDADILYMETSSYSDIAVSKADDGGSRLDIEAVIPGRQSASRVNHYYMDISAAAEDRTIEADSGVLWLESGPGAKYMHGVNANVNGAATVDILPASMDHNDDRGRRLIFKVVSGVYAGDQIMVEVATHADGDTVAADADTLSVDYDILASITGVTELKAGLDAAASADLALKQYVIAVDSNEAGDSKDHYGLKVTFDRGNAEADLGMGAGLALHWRVVGS